MGGAGGVFHRNHAIVFSAKHPHFGMKRLALGAGIVELGIFPIEAFGMMGRHNNRFIHRLPN